MSLEMLQDTYSGGNSSANSASRGRGNFRGRGRGNGRGGEGGRGNFQGRGGGSQKSSKQNSSGQICQICKKGNHEAPDCWYRYDEDYQVKTAGSASTGYGIDTNWYADSGASDHITSELERLTVRDKYHGQDQVRTASGSGMHISSIGHSTLHTHNTNLHLRNILHVPSASKHLISVHRLAQDNNIFFEFYPTFFLIKDRATKKILHQGRCEGGLYPLESSSSRGNSDKQVFGVNKLSTSRWHSRLGHPSFSIVNRVLRDNNLPCHNEKDIELVCDSCQRAKSHQLPYSLSDNVSKAPLDLIHSDIWGPAPTSVGRYSYYVSFIDDYSRYTWLYLLKKKSDIYQVFQNFQNLVERKFDRKILSMQTDWGENMKN
jgi:histone deacetylase 1/2